MVGIESLRKSTMYGGAGILAKQKTLPGMLAAGTKDGAAATLAESGRYVRAAIPLKREGRKQFLHITNMYLEPQFDTPAQARKERMMKLALEDIAKLGDQAALICVDQNCSTMSIMEAAIEAGDWVDLGKRFAVGDPEPTYGRDKTWDKIAAEHRTSRPDRVYANAIAAQAITRYRLIRHTGIPQHLPIEIKFCAATLKKKYIAIQPPAAFPVDEHQRTEEEQEKEDQRIAAQYKQSFEASRAQGNVESAWQIFHQAAEDYLEWLCNDVSEEKKSSWRKRSWEASEVGGT